MSTFLQPRARVIENCLLYSWYAFPREMSNEKINCENEQKNFLSLNGCVSFFDFWLISMKIITFCYANFSRFATNANIKIRIRDTALAQANHIQTLFPIGRVRLRNRLAHEQSKGEELLLKELKTQLQCYRCNVVKSRAGLDFEKYILNISMSVFSRRVHLFVVIFL